MRLLKLYFLIFFVILRIGANKTIAQNMAIVYETETYKVDSVILKLLPENSVQKIKYRYTLTINNTKSRFSLDSIYIEKYTNNGKLIMPPLEIYKDYVKDEWIKLSGRYVDNDCYSKRLTREIDTLTSIWKITTDYDTILGIKCQRAVLGDSFAWFSTEILIADGPNEGYFELPGLVLCMDNGREKCTAKEIRFDNVEQIILPQCAKSIKEHMIMKDYRALYESEDKGILKITSKTQQGVWHRL